MRLGIGIYPAIGRTLGFLHKLRSQKLLLHRPILANFFVQWTATVSDGVGGTDQKTFTITVSEVNQSPALAPIGNRTAMSDEVFTFTATATDPDIPANTLTFSLDAGAPVGATIDPATGVLTWAPPTSANETDVPITIRVTANGLPALSDFETITVHVSTCPFDDALTGWTVTQSGGSAIGMGDRRRSGL